MALFRQKWAEFDPDGTSFIAMNKLPALLLKVGPPIGWDNSYIDNEEKQVLFVADLELPVYDEFTTYNFMDILEALSLKLMVETNFGKHDQR